MSEYVDTKLLNCNRAASVEARSGNNENPALFTNPLQETIRLDVGDKVSCERAFISEIGAGNPQTIEFKGQTIGRNPVPTYTKMDTQNFYNVKSTTYDEKYRLGGYRSIETTLVEGEDVDLRDNLAPLITGYYITANEYPNYIQQPRRFAQPYDTRGSIPESYTIYDGDDDVGAGMTHHTVNKNCFVPSDWIERHTGIYKQIVDNTRYTLFIKDHIAYSILDIDVPVSAVRSDVKQFPIKYKNGVFQECNYLRVRDRIDIEVNKGFNTPSAIANQISKILTDTKKEEIFSILDGLGFKRDITKTVSTTTYKPINAQNLYNFCNQTLTGYLAQPLPVDTANITQLAVDYIGTFGYIAVKRPEIFEAGRAMAKELAITQLEFRDDNGDLLLGKLDAEEGMQIVTTLSVANAQAFNSQQRVLLNIVYNEKNLGEMLKFFDSCRLYPELWDNILDSNYYSPSQLDGRMFDPKPDDSRFFHINTYQTANAGIVHNETFGDDSFSQRGGVNNVPMETTPLFFSYDDTKRNDFILGGDYEPATDGLMYGFARPVLYSNYTAGGVEEKIYLIEIDCTVVGGIPHGLAGLGLFTDPGLEVGESTIKAGRRIGYDFHSTAFSTAIITPFSGYSNVDIGVENIYTNVSNQEITIRQSDTNNWIRAIGESGDANATDLSPYMTQTYIGANSPAIDYNTTSNRFEFKRLHTANNIGNKLEAGSQADSVNNSSMYPKESLIERKIVPPDVNEDAAQTVYKINPRPPQFGFSPTFKPYQDSDAAYRRNTYPWSAYHVETNNVDGLNTQIYDVPNVNISAYKIFDAHGGIYIDNWGFSLGDWEDNLWDILGFDYPAIQAVPSEKNVLSRRVNNENSDFLYRPTTNAEVATTDTKVYVTNQYGTNMYYTSLPYPRNVINYKIVGTGAAGKYYFQPNDVKGQSLELWNEVSVVTKSTSITATDLQKSVLRPYYTIRSSILEGHTALGGNPTGANLPLISIVDKYSAQGDYFFGNPSGITFTITKPTMLADIITSIHDSDGNYSNVDNTSAVIYKIEKIRQTPEDIIQKILKQEKKK